MTANLHWRAVLGALGFWCALCSGTLYAYSAFVEQIVVVCELPVQQLHVIYSAGQLGVGFGVLPGYIFDRFGPVGACLYAFVLLVAGNWSMAASLSKVAVPMSGGLASDHQHCSVTSLAVSYFMVHQGSIALLQGNLFANIHVAPRSRKGAVSGFILAGFGLSGALWSRLFRSVFVGDLRAYFLGTSAVFGATALLGAIALPALVVRAAGQAAARDQLATLEDGAEGAGEHEPLRQATPDVPIAQIARATDFWLFAAVFAVLQAVGSGVFIANAALMTKSAGSPRDEQLDAVSFVSYGNTLGRLFGGVLLDGLELLGVPRGAHCVGTGLLLVIAVSALVHPASAASLRSLLFPALVCIGAAYGWNFATLPAFLATKFGQANLGVCFGTCTMILALAVLCTSTTAGGLYDAAAYRGDPEYTRWEQAFQLAQHMSLLGLALAAALFWRLLPLQKQR